MRSLTLLTSLLLAACGSVDGNYRPGAPTLADLQPVALPPDSAALPQVAAPQLTQIYRDLLTHQNTPASRLQIMHRLADIEMRAAEEALTSGDTQQHLFDAAIESYTALLRDYPDYTARDQILYQLAKAHDLNGNSAQSHELLQQLTATTPDSPYLTEAQFRRAERAFAEADYAAAEQLYSAVTSQGVASPYATRALYMQGWTRYKQADYAGAIDSFTRNLDNLLPHEEAIAGLDRGNRELVNDSLRVLGLAFSHLAGAQTIASVTSTADTHPYRHLLYQSLGDLYLSQERYRDSADTFSKYRSSYPRSRWAQRYQIQVINAYQSGGFRDLILSAKQDYVRDYAVTGDYWQQSSERQRTEINGHLGTFLEELANHYHALAQEQRRGGTGKSGAQAHYALAARYYEAFLQSFPADPQAARLALLLADSLYEAGNYAQAIVRYEQVAYVYDNAAGAADAAYSAILAYDKLTPPDDDLHAHNRKRIAAQLRFFAAFPQDDRAPAVLAHAAQALFGQQDYAAALDAANTLTQQASGLAAEQLTAALLLQADALFELQRFADAEQAYHAVALQMSGEDARLNAVVERLAASIYRQAEAQVRNGQDLAAAQQFSRVLEAAPTSAIRLNAQYDAAAAFMRAGALTEANALLLDFRQRFPQHELSAGIAGTLVTNYEQQEQWHAAAAELDQLQASQPPGEQSRQALLVAAQYYEKAADIPSAIKRYRNYATLWQTPVAQHLEVLDKLSTLLQEAGRQQEYDALQGEIMQAHDSAGEQQSPRSTYLAARACSVLAEDAYNAFRSIKLRQPLRDSLREKKRAMERSLTLYSKCNTYAVEEFSTLSNYRIADLYHHLSRDLLASQRPESLDSLALEQYELMLEEQAFPFEEKAIAAHESNIKRCQDGVYDEWVRRSFDSLAQLLPARYRKPERTDDESIATTQGFFKRRAVRKVLGINEEAIALREQGDFAAAEQRYLRALSIAEEHAATHRNIGILYDLYVGDPDKALRHYKRYQSLTGDSDRAMAGWIADLQRRHSSTDREVI